VLVLVAGQSQAAPGLLVEAARALVQAQPAMAPIFTLANRVLLAGGERTPAVCHDFLSRIETAGRAAGEHAASLIRPGASVLTHSFSSTVLGALLLANRAGRRFDVICTESRPVGEGAELAKRLAREGVSVRLVVDAAAYSFLRECRLVLVGADAVGRRGLVNKIGTAAVALAARALGVRVYAVCGPEKFLPAAYEPPPEPPKDSAEILEEQVPGLTPVNYYFESTPLEYLTGVVTEEGVLAPADLESRLSHMPVHEALLG
jgi:translation initiation factor eIF-2B subunit delta